MSEWSWCRFKWKIFDVVFVDVVYSRSLVLGECSLECVTVYLRELGWFYFVPVDCSIQSVSLTIAIALVVLHGTRCYVVDICM